MIIFGTMLALGLAEIGLRQFGPLVDPAATNPWLGCVGWAGQPHQQEKYLTDEFTTTETINAYGLPDVEHTYTKPPGVFRILIIGNSYVEAYQVDLEQSFPRRLEQLLNQQTGPNSPHFEVIKAGYRSWGTDQEWLYYQCEGYKYAPDLVLVGFTINDVVDNYLPLKAKMVGWPENAPPKPYFTLENGALKQYNFPFPPPPAEVQPQMLYDYFYKYFVTFRVTEKGWQSFQLKMAELNRPPDNAAPEVTRNRFAGHTSNFTMPLFMTPTPPEYEQAWQLTRALLTAFYEEVSGQNIPFAVFANSDLRVVDPLIRQEFILSDPAYANASLNWDQPDQTLAEILQTLAIPHFALNPDFTQYAAQHNNQQLFFKEGHWNEAGHQLAAELLYKWLLEQQLIPQ